MLCPTCMVQMHQKIDFEPANGGIKPIFFGGGTSEDDKYETWEIKQCPVCEREVEELYSCRVTKPGKKEEEPHGDNHAYNTL